MLHDPPAQRTVPVPEPAALRSGDPRTIGPFRVRSRLGSGGMGDVYLGTTRRGEQVAIKLIRGAQLHDDEFRTRFRREVRAAAKVRSRFIANLIDADPDAELPWLATEYVPGPTLSQALAAQGPLREDEVLRLVAGVTEALHEIHRAGLVHRDVKPANVILGPDGPRLIDLGVVASVGATRLTMTGQPVGTPMYMAPEQASGSRVTSAADVWALGALAYYAATGNHLFEGDHPAVVLYRVAASPPSYDDCPPYLRPFLDALLVKDPEHRPTLDAILHSLGAAEPAGATLPLVKPRRVRGAERRVQRSGVLRSDGQRGRRRRPLVVLSSVVAGTAVLAGAAFGIWSSLTDDDREPADTGQTLNTAPTQNSPSPVQVVADGSLDHPWTQGTVRHLENGSCWIASVTGVEGRRATLTLACDQVGTEVYGNPTPSAYLGIYAVGQDGKAEKSTVADATAQDTFWTQGNLTDTMPVTVTVTLPDVAPLAAVEVRQESYGYSWHWDATR
ncbi:serine/threonine-protein kinase [Promicromonospora sp. NPDC023805]|uniref:serine/threonine-protein kinase n=1 Tax=Promicromonospora sp. NPDC023805 TaxID=3154696 RepID=UPI0033D254C3